MVLLIRQFIGVLLVARLGVSTAAAPVPAEFDLRAVEGVYELAAQRCVLLHDKQREACDAGIKDRMVIQRIDAHNARVIVHSRQENMHECHVDGVAETVDGRLRLCLSDEPGTCLTLSHNDDRLKLAVKVEGHAYVPFCGSRATLDGLVFPLAARLPRAPCPHVKQTSAH